MRFRRSKITPELVAQALIELTEDVNTCFTLHNKTFGAHGTAINAHEERMGELESAVASLLKERVE